MILFLHVPQVARWEAAALQMSGTSGVGAGRVAGIAVPRMLSALAASWGTPCARAAGVTLQMEMVLGLRAEGACT